MLVRRRMSAPLSLAPSPCLLVLWLSVYCGAKNHMDMLLTTYGDTNSYIQIYRFSEELFEMFYNCLCQDFTICNAYYYRTTYTNNPDFLVSWIDETPIDRDLDPSYKCRYYTCSVQLQSNAITCDVHFSRNSLISSNSQFVNYTRNHNCRKSCSTFYWPSVNEKLVASPPNLFEGCQSGCSDRSSSTHAVTSTTSRTKPWTSTNVKTTNNSTQTSSASSDQEISSIYSTVNTSASITSTPLSKTTSPFNVSSSLEQTNKDSSTIVIAVVIPLLIVIVVVVFILVVFLWRRRQLSKQQILGQNVQGSSLVSASSAVKQEPSEAYSSLPSQRESHKNNDSEENVSIYESVDLDFTGSNSKNSKFTPNSINVVKSNAKVVESRLENVNMSNIISYNATGSRIVYFPDRNSRDESDDTCESIYSLATCDVFCSADENATEKQLKKKQHINTRPGENENYKIKNMLILVKQDDGCDQENFYMDIDNMETGYSNGVVVPLKAEEINKTKGNATLPDTTNEEIYIDDNVVAYSSSTSGTYNNMGLESDKAVRINVDGLQEDAEFQEFPSYYYSSNTEVLRNIKRDKDVPEEVAVESSGELTSHVDKDSPKTIGEVNKNIIWQFSDPGRMKSTNEYSNLRNTPVNMIHPYNSLQLQD